MMNRLLVSVTLALSLLSASSTKVILTNDDGWAVAQICAEYTALKSAGYSVILSAPAANKSGTGSSTTTLNSVDYRLQVQHLRCWFSRIRIKLHRWVDAVKYGIQTLSPSIFSSAPDLVISGTNIGTNPGSGISGSGTVGAASEAALEGIPSIAFSGSSASQVSYTTLSDTTLSSTKTANIYTALVLKLTAALLNNTGAILPAKTSLNVNFASTSSCTSASSYKFVLTRLVASSTATDVTTCGTSKLTAEATAITKGCIATVSVFNATTKADVGAATQAIVLAKLSSILGCL